EGAKRKVRSAMIYPAIVLGLAVVVMRVLIGFVLPAFASLFGEFRATMPLPTRVPLAIRTFCREHPPPPMPRLDIPDTAGSLDANLEQAAEHYAEEVDYRLKRMIAVIEPALVIAVGVMVGFIAVSVIAPMYALVHAIH